MRKLLFVAILALLSQVGFAQAVQDNAVIPVSVTLNSILRLNVTSGGNIQFVFNTMAQYNGGIVGTNQTTTTFNVASSRPYEVQMGSEDADLLGVEAGGTMDLGVIQYLVTSTVGAGTVIAGTNALDTRANNIQIAANAAATGIVPDEYTVLWSAGTDAGFRATGYAPDVYVTNVYLTLIPN